MAHCYRNEAETASLWLDPAYLQSKGSQAALKVEPLFRKWHGDPRFGTLLRNAKLA